MEAKDFKSLVLELTLKCVDRKPEDWFTFNDTMNTRLVNDNYQPQKVGLNNDELPIIECDLENSYFLVTTNRLITIDNKIFDDINFLDMIDFCKEYEKVNYRKSNGEFPKVNIFCIEKLDGTKFFGKIDSHYPAFFTRILISNIFLYKKEKRWFLNPSEKKLDNI